MTPSTTLPRRHLLAASAAALSAAGLASWTGAAQAQADGHPDMTVRLIADGRGIGMSMGYGDGAGPHITEFPDTANRLQLAEALQFAADTIGSTVPGRLSPFVRGWISTAADSHHNAKSKGFWEPGVERNDSEMIMLVVTELAEAVEGLRHGNPPDDKVPEFSAAEAEFADAIIRMMDQAHARGWRRPSRRR